MSVKIMGQAWDLELPASKLLVLLALADHADHNGNNAYPSIDLLAWKTGYSERQVRRILKSLVKDKILIQHSRPGKVSIFSIDVNAGKKKAAYTKKTGQNVTPDKMSEDTIVSDQPGHNSVRTTPDIQMSDEPSLEPSINHLSRKRDEIFDSVALGSFGVQQVNGDKQAGARIGKIAAWLKKQADITPSEVTAFYGWYGSETRQSPPRDVGKFAEWFLKFREKSRPAKITPGHPIEGTLVQPVPTVLTPEEIAARKAAIQELKGKMK